MAKGSVRKKGKKWYYRFYVEDASGNLVQKECVGTESKSETEKLLRQAMDDYEKKKFVAKADNLTVGQLLDVWAEEELKTGTLSNGTVENYLGTIRNIKKHPLAERKLKNVTSEHLQSFFDLLSFGGVHPDGKERKGYSKDYIHSFSAVMQQSFRFAVFPKQYITFNPMQYIKLRYQTDEVDLFSDEDMDGNVQPISREDYERLLAYLQKKNPAAILPIQIAYYAGLRIGEACGLAWQDVNLEEQCLTIRRSIRYDGSKRKYIIGPTKRKKVRVVDFGDTLVEIFRNARKEQLKNRMQYEELYHTNYYKEVKEKNRVYYEYYCLDRTQGRRGESVISIAHWAKLFGWKRSRTRYFFNKMYEEGIIERVINPYITHIRIPSYDLLVGQKRRENAHEEANGVTFEVFWAKYHEVTQKPKTNIGRARREWKKLSPHERSLSLKNIDEYYDNLTDTKYCMQASTYLSDKAFLNEYDY